jgi:hypothetical protein
MSMKFYRHRGTRVQFPSFWDIDTAGKSGHESCLPLITHPKLVDALLLESTLTPHVFAPAQTNFERQQHLFDTGAAAGPLDDAIRDFAAAKANRRADRAVAPGASLTWR